MKSYRIDINTVFGGDDNSSAVVEFVSAFSEVLYAGKGGYPAMLKKLAIGPDFPMRCLVGIAEEDFSHPLRVLAEAYLGFFMDVGTADVWTTERMWRPTNRGRIAAPLEQCVFDVDFALSLGLSPSPWENEILMSPGAFARQAGSNSFSKNARYLLALAVYGFSDPWQFFTSAK